MKKLIAFTLTTLFASSLAFSQDKRQDQPIGTMTPIMKLAALDRALNAIHSTSDVAPTNSQEAFELRSSIDSAKENKLLGYCINGVIGSRVSIEVPFKIGRKKACIKGITEMIERTQEAIEDVYEPLHVAALDTRDLADELSKDEAITGCAVLTHLLKRHTRVTQRSAFSTTVNGRNIKIREAVKRLKKINRSHIPAGKKDMIKFARNYQNLLMAVDLYAQNFRYSSKVVAGVSEDETKTVRVADLSYYESIQELQDSIEESRDLGCLK